MSWKEIVKNSKDLAKEIVQDRRDAINEIKRKRKERKEQQGSGENE